MSGSAIIVGGGLDGLACAARLAANGRRVTLVEQHAAFGGLSARETFHPGFATSGLTHDTTGLRPALIDGLRLRAHGLRLREHGVDVSVPDGNGRVCTRRGSDDAMVDVLRGRIEADAHGWRQWRGFIDRVGPALGRLFDKPAPDPDTSSLGGLLGLAATGLSLRSLGKRGMADVLRVLPQAADDWLGEHFDDGALCVALTVPALTGCWLGPTSPGSGGMVLLREALAGPGVVGGPAALVGVLVSAARMAGVELRASEPVERVLVRDGRAWGVALRSGETLAADDVVLACDPRHALLDLLPRDALGDGLRRRLAGWRCRGTTARLDLALDAPAVLAGSVHGEPLARAVLGARDLRELELAFNAIKYGEPSARPVLDVWQPTLEDPSLAPSGQHVLSVLIQWVPHDIAGGWTDARRAELRKAVFAVLDEHIPGLSGRVLGERLLTPVDLAEQHGLTGGHLLHGELALDQLLHMRPDPELAQHRTPLPGLALCGRGVHPGALSQGGSGWLAAGRLLKG